ncbi:MAG TPA: protein kinase [Longimicrobium sp.]|jgi:hypothetical protein
MSQDDASRLLLTRLDAALAARYSVRRELGRGGMGTVFQAEDLKYGRPVALKVLHPELAHSIGAQRFLAEIQLAAKLTHPHIVTVYDSGEADGLLYYVMPYVEGESLRERLDRSGPLPPDEAVHIALEAADALDFAHARGVVHRDIKPENILLAHGHASVADFGVARAVSTAAEQRLTATGLIVGSPPYMSPEQTDPGAPVDGRADVYSLGCVLHEMLSGTPPFGSNGVQATVYRHLTQAPPPLRTLRGDVPPALESIVLRALEKQPADRFATAGEMRRALIDPEAAASSRPLRDEAPSVPRRRSRGAARRWRVALAALVLGALAAMGAAVWRGTRAERVDGPTGIAVLPFQGSPTGSEAVPPDRWLASSLGLLRGLRVVDGRSLLGGQDWRAVPLDAVLEKAAKGGARYLIAGSLLTDGRERRLTVEVYASGGGGQIYSGAAMAGESTPQALDRMALEVVRVVAEAEDRDLGAFGDAASETTSLAALTELIQGQRHFRRGETDQAVASFRRAIRADSSFGPAYYRLSVAETSAPRWNYPAALLAVEAGLRRPAEMAPRWVELLKAQRHLVRRSVDSASVQFQKVAAENPGLPDALLGLGEVLFHSGGLLGERATVALPVFLRLDATDSAYAPVASHIVDLALHTGDEALARRHLPRVSDPHRMRETALALRFGGPRARAAAFATLRGAEVRTLATLAALFVQGGLDLPLADSVASLLTAAGRPQDERLRGARFRLAALAGQGRWPEAAAMWDSASGRPPFDAWMVSAYLAGLPARDRAEPMFRWAWAVVEREPPSFAPLTGGEAKRLEGQDALRALVHRATIEGDSAEAARLLRIVRRAAPTADASDPEPDGLEASLHARLALLAGDTARAVVNLERAVARAPWSTSWYMPLADQGLQRLLLARLLAARGDRRGAERRLRSFGQLWLMGDALYFPAATRARAALERGVARPRS